MFPTASLRAMGPHFRPPPWLQSDLPLPRVTNVMHSPSQPITSHTAFMVSTLRRYNQLHNHSRSKTGTHKDRRTEVRNWDGREISGLGQSLASSLLLFCLPEATATDRVSDQPLTPFGLPPMLDSVSKAPPATPQGAGAPLLPLPHSASTCGLASHSPSHPLSQRG